MFIAVAGAAVAINLLASRLKSYSKEGKRFLNIMQFSALLSLAGVVLFAISLIKADLINFYISIDLLVQVTKDMTDVTEMGIALAVLAGMSALTILTLAFLFKSAMKLVTRAACMGKGGGSGMFVAITGLLLLIVNTLVITKYGIELSAEQTSAMTMSFIGIAIVLVGAITYDVLKTALVRNITREETNDIMSGVAQ